MGYQKIIRLPEGYFGWKVFLPDSTQPADGILGIGDDFPSCQFAILYDETDRSYLKIQGRKKSFALEDAGCEYLFIVIYNKNCLACVDETKTFKTMYQQMNTSSYLSDRVKLLAIGAGSKKRDVIAFKKDNAIPYPLFGDEKRSIFSRLGNPVLPTSYLIHIQPGGRRQILFVQQDHIQDVETLIQKITSLVKDTEQPKE
ncbi:MAG: redoxin domain-containing protein [Deltaproteobacteria bacterium]|nr:redoxin domain-containing protein [Deltaproteobacteria bacterium]